MAVTASLQPLERAIDKEKVQIAMGTTKTLVTAHWLLYDVGTKALRRTQGVGQGSQLNGTTVSSLSMARTDSSYHIRTHSKYTSFLGSFSSSYIIYGNDACVDGSCTMLPAHVRPHFHLFK
ncbi:hypothetical protein ACRALDRAFT_207260 [Sodiomyces alcalophilus JCM 7366]|uniref:uncharacterized protein n=1 Tax=Sodiomyces alcalophilus JCM 7366 TaxID=591952 RepID=UPI0039B5554D